MLTAALPDVHSWTNRASRAQELTRPIPWGAAAGSPPSTSPSHPHPQAIPQAGHLPPMSLLRLLLTFQARKATQSETAEPLSPFLPPPHQPSPPAHPSPKQGTRSHGGVHITPSPVMGGWVLPRREMSLLLVPVRHCCSQPGSAEKWRAGVERAHHQGQKKGWKKVLRAPGSTGHQEPLYIHMQLPRVPVSGNKRQAKRRSSPQPG